MIFWLWQGLCVGFERYFGKARESVRVVFELFAYGNERDEFG